MVGCGGGWWSGEPLFRVLSLVLSYRKGEGRVEDVTIVFAARGF